jgi:GNAT superfamily N-acetyltransferase
MPAVAENVANSIIASVGRRWQDSDPLLPAPAPPPGCGASLTAAGADGQTVAIGSCEHWAGTDESLDVAWGTARRFQLATSVAGPDVRGALDQLLAQWRDHLADTPGTDDDDSAAIVDWPSRDIDGVAALVRRGFSPTAVVAARAMGRHPGGPADGPGSPAERPASAGGPAAYADGAAHADGSAEPGPDDAPREGVTIRRAGPADLDVVIRLGLEVIKYDAHFGNGGERPGTRAALRKEAAASLLAGPEPWTWLAERDGEPVGLVAAQRPKAAGWIASMARPAGAAYLMLGFVAPGERGSGVGTELVARLHRDVGVAGVPVTLLHYELLNPLSAPFWSQQGYRPLWTTWEARPARAVR